MFSVAGKRLVNATMKVQMHYEKTLNGFWWKLALFFLFAGLQRTDTNDDPRFCEAEGKKKHCFILLTKQIIHLSFPTLDFNICIKFPVSP